MSKLDKQQIACPCGLPELYARCCGRYIQGDEHAPTAETLMRSRYSAYTFGDSSYVLATWFASTSPKYLNLSGDKTRWKKLVVISAGVMAENSSEGVVEFVAHYKLNGKAGRLHERSHFLQENGRWYYVKGEILE